MNCTCQEDELSLDLALKKIDDVFGATRERREILNKLDSKYVQSMYYA